MSRSLTAREEAGWSPWEPVEFRPNNLQRLALICVWVTIASGAVVFSEPAPVDLLTMGLIVLLPLVGLATIPGTLWFVLSVWLLCAAGAFVASAQSLNIDRSTIHSAISLYLYASFFVLAAFVAKRPAVHTKLIFDAYLWAALVGAIAGIVGYFGLLPGATDLFTRYGRATGTFKDPNVYGPFLAVAALYALHRVLNDRPLRTILPGIMLLLLSFAMLLSFSRGAWINAGVGIVTYTCGAILLARTDLQQVRIIMLATVVASAAVGILAAAAQFDQIGGLLSSRAALQQDYDSGPHGRFSGQAQAMEMILDHPLGLGALQFGMHYHHEDVHNVYLSMFLNAGWLGGQLFAAIMVLTVLAGACHLLRATSTQPLFLVAYSAFLGNVVEGFVVDTDHWRHLYLLLAIVWGLIAVERGWVLVPVEEDEAESALVQGPWRRRGLVRGQG